MTAPILPGRMLQLVSPTTSAAARASRTSSRSPRNRGVKWRRMKCKQGVAEIQVHDERQMPRFTSSTSQIKHSPPGSSSARPRTGLVRERLPIVASVERCGWEMPAWTLQGEANFELGAAFRRSTCACSRRTRSTRRSTTTRTGLCRILTMELVVHDCDDSTLSRAVMVSSTDDSLVVLCGGSCSVNGQVCPTAKSTAELATAARRWLEHVDELPETRLCLRGCRGRSPR